MGWTLCGRQCVALKRKRFHALTAVSVVASLLMFPSEAHALAKQGKDITFYVSIDGSDTWSGKIAAPNATSTDGPFATLAQARDAVRDLRQTQMNSKEPIKIVVRGGKYFLAEPLLLDKQDSGTPDLPIVWTAYSGEKPVLSGGRKITGWKPYQGKILEADLPAAKDGKWRFRQLFFNGKEQIRARTPNFDPDNPLYGGWAYMRGSAGSDAFKYGAGLFKKRLSKPSLAEVYFYVGAGAGWGSDIIAIKSIDYDNLIVHARYSMGEHEHLGFTSINRFRVENALEELDQPGEWCLDWEEGKAYFWPPTGLGDGGEVIAPALGTLMTVCGTKWLTISGITFTETSGGDAMRLEGVEHVTIRDNHFHAVGNNALSLIGTKDGESSWNVIQHNEFSYAGNEAIDAGGRLRSNQIVDNHIYHCGAFNKYAHPITVRYLNVGEKSFGGDNLIAHNYIHDIPTGAIHVANPFSRYVIEYNEIRRAGLEGNEVGAIVCRVDTYTGVVIDLSDIPEMAGHIIRHNLIADVPGCRVEGDKCVTPNHWTFAIYLDDLSANCKVYGNIVARAGYGFWTNAGRRNTVENNIFVNCWNQISFGVPPHLDDERVYQYVAENRILKNIIYNDAGADTFTIKFHSDAGIFRTPESRKRVVAESDYNLLFRKNGDYSEFGQWQNLGYDGHSLTTDPMFVDPKRDNYRLKAESPALKMGFEPVDLRQVGVRHNRKSEASAERDKSQVKAASARDNED
ncbi:MAG: right-handed parallel beta-helix repeat-containing protein [Armatimonadetes bacterium]|nr:right-handed parallel beta-helix repeat-containing protein [Armatimonadota bacterium]